MDTQMEMGTKIELIVHIPMGTQVNVQTQRVLQLRIIRAHAEYAEGRDGVASAYTHASMQLHHATMQLISNIMMTMQCSDENEDKYADEDEETNAHATERSARRSSRSMQVNTHTQIRYMELDKSKKTKL